MNKDISTVTIPLERYKELETIEKAMKEKKSIISNYGSVCIIEDLDEFIIKEMEYLRERNNELRNNNTYLSKELDMLREKKIKKFF